MKYMLMVMGDQASYDAMSGKTGDSPWTPDHMQAMFAYMSALNDDLAESGELVDAQGLTAPSQAKRVSSKEGVPVVSDGPFGETKEMLAGYWVVEVASEQRAIEIAARAYACPTPPGQEGPPLLVQPLQEGAPEDV